MNEFRRATDDIKREFREGADEFKKDLEESKQDINNHIHEINNTFSDSDSKEVQKNESDNLGQPRLKKSDNTKEE